MRTFKGTVVSAKMNKTIVVRVDRLQKHPKYGKHYRMSKKFKVHDEKGEYRAGDMVLVEEMRPLSREKRWRATELIKRPIKEEEEAASEDMDTKKSL